MTTETESIELTLAKRFESLQQKCIGVQGDDWCPECGERSTWRMVCAAHDHRRDKTCPCEGRGWVPNVTMDGLLEALADRGWYVNEISRKKSPHYTFQWDAGLSESKVDKHGVGAYTSAVGPTPREALMRAAVKATE